MSAFGDGRYHVEPIQKGGRYLWPAFPPTLLERGVHGDGDGDGVGVMDPAPTQSISQIEDFSASAAPRPGARLHVPYLTYARLGGRKKYCMYVPVPARVGCIPEFPGIFSVMAEGFTTTERSLWTDSSNEVPTFEPNLSGDPHRI